MPATVHVLIFALVMLIGAALGGGVVSLYYDGRLTAETHRADALDTAYRQVAQAAAEQSAAVAELETQARAWQAAATPAAAQAQATQARQTAAVARLKALPPPPSAPAGVDPRAHVCTAICDLVEDEVARMRAEVGQGVSP